MKTRRVQSFGRDAIRNQVDWWFELNLELLILIGAEVGLVGRFWGEEFGWL
jgi:hypothetical protein